MSDLLSHSMSILALHRYVSLYDRAGPVLSIATVLALARFSSILNAGRKKLLNGHWRRHKLLNLFIFVVGFRHPLLSKVRTQHFDPRETEDARSS